MKNGNHNTLRLFSVILLCSFLSAGTTAWGQTRSTTTSTSRTPTRTEKATDARTVKKAAETRSAEAKSESVKKAAEKKQETVRKETVKQESTRNREVDAKRETQSQREADVRDADTRGADVRSDGTRDAGSQRRPVQQPEGVRGGRSSDVRIAPSTRLSSGYRLAPGNSRPERTKVQLRDIRFRHDNERCGVCFGIGFMYNYDRLHRLRCSQCFGRGFAVEYHTHLETICPICYGPVSGFGQQRRLSVQSCARYVTDRLDNVLDLSRSQERKIYSIVVDYLRDSRYDGWFDLVVVRDGKIMRELSNRKRDMYIDFMNNLDSRDLCNRCFDYF